MGLGPTRNCDAGSDWGGGRAARRLSLSTDARIIYVPIGQPRITPECRRDAATPANDHFIQSRMVSAHRSADLQPVDLSNHQKMINRRSVAVGLAMTLSV